MSEPFTAVLVGCGGISDEWLTAIADLDTLDVVGLVDLDPSAAEDQARAFDLDGVVLGDDLDAVLARTAPTMVFDCTVPAAHADTTITALRHGCHVLGEKPLSDSMDAARRVVDAAQASGLYYAVMQNRRFDANIRRLRRLVEGGALGPLTTVHSDFFIGAHMGGFRYHMPHVLLLDMAIHTFDAARLLTGADPVSVYCHEWNPAGSWFAHGASAVAIFEMTGGLVYTYRGSWSSEGLRTSWESQWRLIGTQGTAVWDGADDLRAEVAVDVADYYATVEDVPIPAPDPRFGVRGHAGLLRDFLDCVREGRTPETLCTDNVKSLAMVFAAIESAETGKKVAVRW